jgi:hypothetical protein
VADFGVKIVAPKVVDHLTVKLPTQTKGSAIPLDQFTVEQVEAVGDEYKAALLARREELHASRDSEATDRPPATSTKPPAKKAGKGAKDGAEA